MYCTVRTVLPTPRITAARTHGRRIVNVNDTSERHRLAHRCTHLCWTQLVNRIAPHFLSVTLVLFGHILGTMSQHTIARSITFPSASSTTTPSTSSPTTISLSPPVLIAGLLGGIAAGGLAMHLYHRYASPSASSPSKRSAGPLSVVPPTPSVNNVPATPLINTARPGVFAPASPAFTPLSSPRAPPSSHSLSGRTGRQAVIVVDPISTGANVAFEVTKRGYPCIKVASGYVSPALLNLVDATIRTDFVASIAHDSSDPYKTVQQLRALPFDIIGAISGSELGIEVTDFITEALGIPTNGTELTNARRDKYQMGECVRRHGVRATKQARVQSWPEVQTFLTDLRASPFKVIIKPIRSSGSDHVYLCTSEEELRQRFDEILGQKNQLGFVNDAVVVQEFLEGLEYVVDTVSRKGKHKVVALWEYDKRTFGGFNFVYFGMASVSGRSDVGRALCDYTVKVLDALNIVEGAGHGEVIMTKDGPCLVEIGARCHGCEGTFMPLSDRCWGYNQVGALVDATVSQADFDALPDVCGDMIEFGFKVDFVSNVAGTLHHIDHLDDMRRLPSFVQFDLLPKPGDVLSMTIDCFTAVGSVTLSHKERKVVEADHKKVREWEKTMFVVTKQAPKTPRS